jgi:hypothetical protein
MIIVPLATSKNYPPKKKKKKKKKKTFNLILFSKLLKKYG